MCNKIVFDTLERAVIAAKERRKKGRPVRVYACSVCRRYHLTTKKQKP